MINFNLGVFMYKYTYDLLPTSFNGAFQKLHTHKRNLNYITIVEKSSFVRSIPTSYMPKYWNSLSLEIKRSSSINTFKTALRLNLQSKYNVTCSKQNCYSCSWNCSVQSALTKSNHNETTFSIEYRISLRCYCHLPVTACVPLCSNLFRYLVQAGEEYSFGHPLTFYHN